MQLNITGQNLDITDALRQQVEKVLERLQRHTEILIQNVHVVLMVEKQIHHCDIKIKIGEASYVAKGEAADMYMSIDNAAHKVERQMQSLKGKHKAQRHH